MTQMNTRIDEAVKREGDAVFRLIGMTPSDVVRAVWEFAAQHADAPAIVAEALQQPRGNATSAHAYLLGVARDSSELVARYREAIGATPPDTLEQLDYRQLRENAWLEKLRGADS